MKTLASSLLLLLTVTTLAAAEAGLRIRFGLEDESNTQWDGSISVAPGKVVSVDGWRFQQTDAVTGNDSWKASTRPLTRRRSNNPRRGGTATRRGSAAGLLADNGIIVLLEDVNENSVV